jgi:capsid protein
MSSSNGAVSLSEFTATRRNAGGRRWIDGLPQEVVDEIMASDAGAKVVSDWLKTRGFDGATPKKCELLVDARKKQAVG